MPSSSSGDSVTPQESVKSRASFTSWCWSFRITLNLLAYVGSSVLYIESENTGSSYQKRYEIQHCSEIICDGIQCDVFHIGHHHCYNLLYRVCFLHEIPAQQPIMSPVINTTNLYMYVIVDFGFPRLL